MVWDKTQPQESDAINTGPADIQANNAAIETALDKDHDFTTGGTQTGKHNMVSLIEAADIGTGAEGLPILGAQTADGKAELVFTDEDDNDVQLTSGGSIPSASTDMLDEDDLASDSATQTASQQSIKAFIVSGTATMAAKTLTSPVLNTGVSGTAVLDEDDMASDSATKLATQQSIKAYIDALIAALMTPESYAGNESITFPNGLILKQGTATVDTTPVDATFAEAFPTACTNAWCTSTSATPSEPVAVTAKATTKLTLDRNGGAGSQTVNWFAMGY